MLKRLREQEGEPEELNMMEEEEPIEEEAEIETTDIAPTSMGLMARI